MPVSVCVWERLHDREERLEMSEKCTFLPPRPHPLFLSLSQVRNADSVIRHAPSTYLLIAAAPQWIAERFQISKRAVRVELVTKWARWCRMEWQTVNPQIKHYNRISSHAVKTLQQACSTRYKDETPPTYHIWHPPPPNNTDSRRQCTMKTAADWGRLPSNHLSRRRPKKKLPVNKCCLSGSNPTSHLRDMRTIHFPHCLWTHRTRSS